MMATATIVTSHGEVSACTNCCKDFAYYSFQQWYFSAFKTLLLSEDNKDDISVELLDDAAVDQMRKIKVNHLKTL